MIKKKTIKKERFVLRIDGLGKSLCNKCRWQIPYSDPRYPYCGTEMMALLQVKRVIGCSEFKKRK